MKTLLMKELRDALRNRWLLGYALLLALLGLMTAWLGLSGATGLSLQVFGRTTATLMNLCLLLAPLVALSLGAGAVAGEADRGTLEMLLAQPIDRWELLLGKYLGLLTAIAAATLCGFLPAGLVLAIAAGPATLGPFLLFPLLAAVLSAGMLGLGLWLSVASRNAAQAQSLAIFAWFVLVLLYDLLLLGTLSVGGLPAGALSALLVANPVDAARVLTVLALEPDLYLLGPAGSLLTATLGTAGTAALLGASLLAWVLVPLAGALAVFRLPRHPLTRNRRTTLDRHPPRRAVMKTFRVPPAVLIVLVLLAAAGLAACGGGAPDGDVSATAGTAEPAAETVVTAEMLAHGRNLYVANCAPCHGSEGRGDGPSAANLDPKPRDHTNREYMRTLSNEQLGRTIQMGGMISNMPQMPSHPHIRGEDLVALVAFVRSLSEPPAAQVAANAGP